MVRLPRSGEHDRADDENHPDHETSHDGHGGDPPAHAVTTERPATGFAVRMPARHPTGSSFSQQWHLARPVRWDSAAMLVATRKRPPVSALPSARE